MSKKLSETLLSRIAQHPKVKGKVSLPSLRVAIARIRQDNPRVTLNAAAYLYAKKKGFKVVRYLDDEDRSSLQFTAPEQAVRKQVRQSAKPDRRRRRKLTFGSSFDDDASANADVYPYLYILENSIRAAILEEFKAVSNWWNNTAYVHKGIQKYARDIQEAEKKYPWVQNRGGHPIYYVGLYELYRIITKNWGRLEHIFKDQGNLRTWFNEVVPVRNLVAHNVATSSEERKNVQIRTRFICTSIENAKKP